MARIAGPERSCGGVADFAPPPDLHIDCVKTWLQAAPRCGKAVDCDLSVGGFARAEHRQPFPERHAQADLRRRLGCRLRSRRLFCGFSRFVPIGTAIDGVPQVDVQPFDLVAQQQNGAARGTHFFTLVERQAFPPTPQQRELLFVQAIRGRVLETSLTLRSSMFYRFGTIPPPPSVPAHRAISPAFVGAKPHAAK